MDSLILTRHILGESSIFPHLFLSPALRMWSRAGCLPEVSNVWPDRHIPGAPNLAG